MRARGKRSSCAPTPPANPIPIASVERGRGRGKGRREEERGGRRCTWNPAPAWRRRLSPCESGPSATRLRERESVPSATPALSTTDSCSVHRNPRAAPRPTPAPSPTATLLCERAIGSYVLPSSFLCCSAALLLLPLLPLLFLHLAPMLCSFLCSTLLSLLCSFLLFMCYSLIVGMDSSQVCSSDVVA